MHHATTSQSGHVNDAIDSQEGSNHREPVEIHIELKVYNKKVQKNHTEQGQWRILKSTCRCSRNQKWGDKREEMSQDCVVAHSAVMWSSEGSTVRSILATKDEIQRVRWLCAWNSTGGRDLLWFAPSKFPYRTTKPLFGYIWLQVWYIPPKLTEPTQM